MRARIASHRALRYFRLSRVVAPFGVSLSFSWSFSAARLALRTASICFCTCLDRSAMRSSVISSSLKITSSRIVRSPLWSWSPRWMTRLAMIGVREIDFTLAREQRDGAHLAQVHAHRIVGLVERARREIELELFRAFGGAVDRFVVAQVLLIGVDDLDARAAEGVEEIVELVRGGNLGRQQFVDLVVQQVAFF